MIYDLGTVVEGTVDRTVDRTDCFILIVSFSASTKVTASITSRAHAFLGLCRLDLDACATEREDRR
jgi:hypothetical protein